MISTAAIATNVIKALTITSNSGDLYLRINNAIALNVAINETYSTIIFSSVFYANNAAPNAIGNADSRNILRAKILYPDSDSTAVIAIKKLLMVIKNIIATIINLLTIFDTPNQFV